MQITVIDFKLTLLRKDGDRMNGHTFGYIRVSSFDQNPSRQLDGVTLDRVFIDKASGKDVQRPELENLIQFVRDGDTVVVHSMDRLARNLDDLRQIVRSLTGKGVKIQFMKENLAFSGEDSPLATIHSLNTIYRLSGNIVVLTIVWVFLYNYLIYDI